MVVDENECRARLGRVGLTFSPQEHLRPVTDREFLVRMLGNLKAIYIRSNDFDRAIWAISRQSQLDPHQGDGFRLLGQQLVKDGNYRHAKKCFRSYLDILPATEHADCVRSALSAVLERQARRN
jgi:regulator of sirC expression with transglutaminase-like and TPR domain